MGKFTDLGWMQCVGISPDTSLKHLKRTKAHFYTLNSEFNFATAYCGSLQYKNGTVQPNELVPDSGLGGRCKTCLKYMKICGHNIEGR